MFRLLIVLVFFNAHFHAIADNFDRTVSLHPRTSGTHYVDAEIGPKHYNVRFLVDTGSGMVVINQSTFKHLKAHHAVVPSRSAAARMANGKIQKVSMYKVSEFSIGDNCQVGPIEVAVIPKGNNILGMSVLNRTAPFAIQVSPPSLILSNCDNPALTAAR